MDDARPTRLFVSYSRRDLGQATYVAAGLREKGLIVLLDKTDIAPGEDWRQRLANLIVGADAVVFLVSETSIASPICAWEIAEAQRLAKRLVPVVIESVASPKVDERLSRLNFVIAHGEGNLDKAIDDIVFTVTTDLSWIREHTRLGERAEAWQRAGCPDADILRGDALAAAEAWLRLQPDGPLEASELHQLFISQSRTRFEREEAEKRERVDSFLAMQSRFLTRQSAHAFEAGDVITALLLAMEALPDAESPDHLHRQRPVISEAEDALGTAVTALCTLRFIPDVPPLIFAVFSADGRIVATGHDHGPVRLWDVNARVLKRTIDVPGGNVRNAAFSEGGRLIAIAAGLTLTCWDVETGDQCPTIASRFGQAESVVFCPGLERPQLAAVFKPGTACLFDATTGMEQAVFTLTCDDTTRHKLLGPRGAQHIFPTWDGSGRIYVAERRLPDFETAIPEGAWRGDLTRRDGSALIWRPGGECREFDLERGHLLKTWEKSVSSVHRLEDGVLVMVAVDGSTTTVGHEGVARSVVLGKGSLRLSAISPDGKRAAIVRAANDKRFEIWDLQDGSRLHEEAADGCISRLHFNSDATNIAIIHGLGKSYVRVIGEDKGSGFSVDTLGFRDDYEIYDVSFSSDGEHFATGGSSNRVRVWATDRLGGWYTEKCRFQHDHSFREDGVRSVDFHPDGNRIVSASADWTVRLWSLARNRELWRVTFGTNVPTPRPSRVEFSPHGTWIAMIDEANEFALLRTMTGSIVPLPDVARERVSSVSFGGGDQDLLITYLDGRVTFWKGLLWSGDLLSLGKRIVPRALTGVERDEHFLSREVPEWCIGLRKWPYAYPEDRPSMDPDGMSYSGFMSSFRDARDMGVGEGLLRSASLLRPQDDRSLVALSEAFLSEYLGRLARNRDKFYEGDSFALSAEAFQSVLDALVELDRADIARLMRADYRGPRPARPFTIG